MRSSPTLDAVHAAAERLRARSQVDVETIVVDNNSSDGTAAVARSRGAAVVHEAMRHATGDVLVFIDADVIVPRTFLDAVHGRDVRSEVHRRRSGRRVPAAAGLRQTLPPRLANARQPDGDGAGRRAVLSQGCLRDCRHRPRLQGALSARAAHAVHPLPGDPAPHLPAGRSGAARAHRDRCGRAWRGDAARVAGDRSGRGLPGGPYAARQHGVPVASGTPSRRDAGRSRPGRRLAGRDRPVRHHRLRGRAADAGDRHPHGARRDPP